MCAGLTLTQIIPCPDSAALKAGSSCAAGSTAIKAVAHPNPWVGPEEVLLGFPLYSGLQM